MRSDHLRTNPWAPSPGEIRPRAPSLRAIRALPSALAQGLLLLAGLLFVGCGASHIPGTTVGDNPRNREVLAFVEEYREAVEEHNVPAILGMASPEFLDDNGTPHTHDYFDRDTLAEQLGAASERILDVRYEFRYRRVSFREDRVFVQYRYTASFLLRTLDGEERWARRVSDNELVLRHDPESGEYRILSGI
ncbi:MAG: hypothetical protein OEY14_08970 [Myxococcales bacterium]|nr:hypothetical protein [Myxococcales bacterium]